MKLKEDILKKNTQTKTNMVKNTTKKQRREQKKKRQQTCKGCGTYFRGKGQYDLHMRAKKKECFVLAPMKQKKNNVPINVDCKNYSVESTLEKGTNKNIVCVRNDYNRESIKLNPEQVMTKAYMLFVMGGSFKTLQVYIHVLEDGLVVQPHEMWPKMEFENYWHLPRSCKDAAKARGFDRSKYAVKFSQNL